jgi:hypothetical protein
LEDQTLSSARVAALAKTTIRLLHIIDWRIFLSMVSPCVTAEERIS